MIDVIYSRAVHGGRQAVAAPRGRGKTEITKGMLCYLILAGLIRFPVPIGQTGDHARKIYEDFRHKLQSSELLAEDFPEVCYPAIDLDGAPLRAGKQHIDGEKTGIVWKVDELCLPRVPEKYRPGIDYGGVRMVYRGLDAAIRGINIDGDRPDFVLIDDPETRESAKSVTQITDRTGILDQDVAGLAGEDYALSIVMLTTIQNRYCLSYNFTDRKQKPAWNGLRFSWVEKWPDKKDMWEEYIALRQKSQEEGDEHGRAAVDFMLANYDAMHAGAELLTDNFKPIELNDGTQLVHSALQEVYNQIADTSMDAFRTEYQNDPPRGEEATRTKLTAGKVQTRAIGLPQGEVPEKTSCVTIGIDIGKYASHWAAVAWSEEGCRGSVIDYGVMETVGLGSDSDQQSIELALLSALEVWGAEAIDKYKPALVWIDSGSGIHRDAVYRFCRDTGLPFFPAKGWDQGRFRMPRKASETEVPFLDAYARWQHDEGVWLYHMQGEAWKDWIQRRFEQAPLAEDNTRTDGSLTLFSTGGDARRHLSFAQHIVSEYEEMRPTDEKGMKRVWVQRSNNNHWLDAMAMACAAAGTLGIRLIQRPAPVPTKEIERKESPFNRNGRPFVATQR